MSRLVAFGCSLTYGHHLPDSKTQSWPGQLARLLDLECVNNSVPGASNIEILSSILLFDFEPTDIVVVGWTYPERDLIFKKTNWFLKMLNWGDHIRVQVGYKNSETKLWLKLHNEYDLLVRSGMYMHHAELYLDSQGLKQHHIRTYPDRILGPTPLPISFKELKYFYKDFKFLWIDKALDNNHPGINSHMEAANKLFKILNEK
jgi:hypothetical protein